MVTETPPADSYLETDIWHWLLFDSGVSRRRAREIILQGAQSNALSLFWQAGPAILSQQLALSPEETSLLRAAQADWPQKKGQFETERSRGLRTLRINEPGYPDSLIHFLPPERRPLLLFLRGEMGLLDLPMVLPVAGTPPADAAEAWALETLGDLTTEGALALFIARAGLEARAVKAFLDAKLPFVLVIPQGLAVYEPPAGLAQALDEDRILLVSPFQPDWRPPAPGDGNPLLPHAVAFARALAHALLALTSPVPESAAGQPCFRGPDVGDGERCPDKYDDAEAFFLRLAEAAAPVPAGVTTDPAQPLVHESSELTDPAEILETLTRGGRIPGALAERLKNISPKNSL